MDEARIRLLPGEGQWPRPSHSPTAWSRRWLSPWEHDDEDAAVSVFVTPRAYVRLCAHAGSDLEQEVGGGLVGTWRRDRHDGREFVIVDGILRARHTRQGHAHVTFTQDSLVALNDELERRYPGKRLVGWYHTHPRLGVFLSSLDTWLHEHFFPELWQVALVIDPHSLEAGFFVRREDGTLDPRRYLGFHELLRNGRESVVQWRNLQPADGVGG
jgi:proteasome lid subunit RPN8/RPN11